MEPEAFNASYYATMAQVIPVFFLALVVSRYWRSRDDNPVDLSFSLVGVVLVSLAGEFGAISALSSHETPSSIERGIITAGWAIPAGFIVATAGWGHLTAALDRMPGRARVAVELGALLLLVGVFAAAAVNFDPTAIVGGVGILLVVLPFFVDFYRLRSGRRTRGNTGSDSN